VRKKIEGKYVIATSEKGLSVLEAVAMYKELAEVEKRVPAAQGRDGDAADLPPDRVAGEGAHLRGGIGGCWCNGFWAVGSRRREWICHPSRAMEALSTVRL